MYFVEKVSISISSSITKPLQILSAIYISKWKISSIPQRGSAKVMAWLVVVGCWSCYCCCFPVLSPPPLPPPFPPLIFFPFSLSFSPHFIDLKYMISISLNLFPSSLCALTEKTKIKVLTRNNINATTAYSIHLLPPKLFAPTTSTKVFEMLGNCLKLL